jgi:hypothetical protein
MRRIRKNRLATQRNRNHYVAKEPNVYTGLWLPNIEIANRMRILNTVSVG